MKQNKKVREKLEKQYGRGCMFKKAKVEEKIEKRVIRTYKKFIEDRKYTGKIVEFYESQMNLHHLKHKAEGGATTVENSAEVCSLAHMYMHSLPRAQEEIINNILRDYKKKIDECKIVMVDDLDVPFTVAPVEFYVDERGKYNRAKKKQEDKRLIDKYYEEKERC